MSAATVLIVVLVGLLAGLVGYQVGTRRGGADIDAAIAAAVHRASAEALAGQSHQLVELASGRFAALEAASQQRWRSSSDEIATRIEHFAQHLARLENERQRDAAVLAASVADLRVANEQVRDEARSLAASLTDRSVRGSWGEMQLRRVLELSGMVTHVDFVEQEGTGGSGGSVRPDVVVRLPNARRVVVDSKVPLEAFMRASSESSDRRSGHLREHAAAVARHIDALAQRRYDEAVDGSVDFVVMFMPGDAFLSAAFEDRPDLLEYAASRGVVLASPSTLLAFLRGVAAGWREQRVADEAASIARLGRELHERIAVFAEHLDGVGVALGRAVGSYNAAVGSLQRRLVVTARRFEEHGVQSSREVIEPATLSEQPVVKPPTAGDPVVREPVSREPVAREPVAREGV